MSVRPVLYTDGDGIGKIRLSYHQSRNRKFFYEVAVILEIVIVVGTERDGDGVSAGIERRFGRIVSRALKVQRIIIAELEGAVPYRNGDTEVRRLAVVGHILIRRVCRRRDILRQRDRTADRIVCVLLGYGDDLVVSFCTVIARTVTVGLKPARAEPVRGIRNNGNGVRIVAVRDKVRCDGMRRRHSRYAVRNQSRTTCVCRARKTFVADILYVGITG